MEKNEQYMPVIPEYLKDKLRQEFDESQLERPLQPAQQLPTATVYEFRKIARLAFPGTMIEAAKKLSYQYIAITDHSKSERIANGLSEEKMLQHIKNIRAIARKTKGITVLAGTEVDILPNGELDYSDELLKKFDIIVASIHSRFKSTKEQMTNRIITALENPYTDILGHPTGRRIGKREPIDADWKKIFEKAAEKKVWLEINAQPERTDLNDLNTMEAKRHGCKFTIDTDAHSTTGLEYMHLGVAVERRAWLGEKDIINTAPSKQLRKFFRRIK